ncbi:MAG: hypothetical protein H6Q98_809 [Nitrospirae bacterium]|nr:hypothetical protein [Nitrospirota bacterium]
MNRVWRHNGGRTPNRWAMRWTDGRMESPMESVLMKFMWLPMDRRTSFIIQPASTSGDT